MGAPGRGHRGLDVPSSRASPRFEQRQHMFEPVRRRPALSCAADDLRGSRCAAFGQAAPRCDQAGHRADQLVRVNPQSGVGQPQLTCTLLYLVAVQMHRCERDTRGGGDVLGQPVAAVLGGLDAPLPLALPARLSRPHRASTSARYARQSARSPGLSGAEAAAPCLEDGDRLVETACPQFRGSAARQHLRPDPGMPCEQACWQFLEQGRRAGGRRGRGIEIPGAAGQCQPDQRCTQPGRDFAVSGKCRRGCSPPRRVSDARLGRSVGQPHRRDHQQRLRLRPDQVQRHARNTSASD